MQESPASGNQNRRLFEVMLLQSLDTKPMMEEELTSCISETFGIVVSQRIVDETLEDLLVQGLIHGKVIEPDEPPKPYRLTSKGRNALTKTESTLISTCKGLKTER